ncbi:uncharacterized protein LOC127867310 isoform X2 [Dreissena polymorpha]|uniref:uncharacterized protein LOC127867310 isoform X2 n=1 Tax=Dreissena polymorpha TaxID=45954 RepID=UPI00226456E2|nr:uncharacterized protein LOC127867310 isoform X2 [Dreissena polymorpha]
MPVQAETCTTGKPERRVCPDYITYRMMSLMLIVIVLKAIHVVDTTEVHIDVKGDIQKGNNITLECSTNATDLTFSFENTVGEKKDVNVAECVFNTPHFFFISETYLAMYNIHMTEKGCILTIINLSTKQYGVYTCFETYPPKNKASVRVEEQNRTAQDTITFARDDTVIADTRIVIGVVVGIIIVIIIVVSILIYRRRQTTKKNTQPSMEKIDETQDHNGRDDNSTAMSLIGITITDQETTAQNTSDIDEQQKTPLLKDASGKVNEIGPINTPVEIHSDSMADEKPDTDFEHLSAASMLSVQKIDGDEDVVDINSTGQHQLDESNLTRESHSSDDSYYGKEYNQQAVCSPGTKSLYRGRQTLHIPQQNRIPSTNRRNK